MLAYVLAIVIAIGSFSFYMAAFFVPEIHRRQDFLWSGLGMFYAVVLWFCAGRITGAVLLGQIVSVALLGWFGWHTFELRRALTPESVRTPVSEKDLQVWGEATQQAWRKYLSMGSLLAGLRAIAADIGAAVADLRNRTAGPRGIELPSSNVPPLKRAPAYEFETQPGQGEAVPSEFATVATAARQPAQSEKRDRPAVTPPRPAITKAPPPVQETLESPLPTDSPKPVAPEPAPTPATPAKARVDQSSRAPQKQGVTPEKTTVTKTSTSVAQRSQPTSNPVTGLTTWVGDVAKSFRKPKPERAVIEIPRRAPSIPRSPDASQPEKPAPVSPEPIKAPSPETNWVDIGDEGESPNWAIAAAAPDVTASETSTAVPPPPEQSDIATPASQVSPTSQPLAANDADDTNWPDDDDTNWPD